MKKIFFATLLCLTAIPLFSQHLVPCEKLFGVLCDSTGAVKIKTDYDDISQIHDYKNMARVKKEGKVGIIELLEGKELFPLILCFASAILIAGMDNEKNFNF